MLDEKQNLEAAWEERITFSETSSVLTEPVELWGTKGPIIHPTFYSNCLMIVTIV